MNDNKYDNVQNPQHYADTNIEPIEVIEDWNLGFCLGNAIKYIKRAGHKKSSSMSQKEKEINDIKKVLWYVNRHLQNLEKEQNKTDEIDKSVTTISNEIEKLQNAVWRRN